jgi:hypothetical protein
MPEGQCPFCRGRSYIESQIDRPRRLISCKRCGRFGLGHDFEVRLGENRSAEERDLIRYLPAHIRRVNSQGEEPTITLDNWQALARGPATTPVSQKIERLLEILGKRSRPERAATFDPEQDAPLIDSPDEKETTYLLGYLQTRGDITQVSSSSAGARSYKLEVSGWQKLEPGPGGIPGRCFVAMSFDASLTDAYESGIYPAVKTDCLLEPIRVDRQEHNEQITDKILNEIRLAEFLVADVTLQRNGVYFEAGFAMGLGRPVIWSVREDELSQVQFDTRQYSHVVWSSAADLRERLKNRIRATIASAQRRRAP